MSMSMAYLKTQAKGADKFKMSMKKIWPLICFSHWYISKKLTKFPSLLLSCGIVYWLCIFFLLLIFIIVIEAKVQASFEGVMCSRLSWEQQYFPRLNPQLWKKTCRHNIFPLLLYLLHLRKLVSLTGFCLSVVNLGHSKPLNCKKSPCG